MSEDIGTVISRIDSPSPSKVDFVVNKGLLHRGMFVELDYTEGKMIAMVTNLVKTNRYFERAESVKEFESNGTALKEQFPVSEWEFLVAETRPLGVFTEEKIKRSTYPPSPGTRVRVAANENLQRFLKFDKEKGLGLGELEYHGLPVNLNLTSLLQKHLAILAQSGFGKSYFVSVMLEELLERKKDQGRIAVVVLDVHGEYTSFAEPVKGKEHKDYSSLTRIVKARDVRISVPRLSIGLLSTMLPGLSIAQKRDLGRIISKLQSEMKSGTNPFNLKTVKTEVSNDSEIKENTKQALNAWLNELESYRLFSHVDNPSIEDLVKPGILTVVDLSDIINVKKKQLIVNYFARKLFNERRQKKLPPFLLILEEAHQFIPEKASRETAIAKGIMETIAREGRKFGASLCLVSQRPIQLSTTVLSQCNNHLILRITNPYDLDHIGKSSEGLDRRSIDMLTSLRVGEALLVGEATGSPVFFKVRKRKSIESRHEISLEKAAMQFEEMREERSKEAKQFF